MEERKFGPAISERLRLLDIESGGRGNSGGEPPNRRRTAGYLHIKYNGKLVQFS